MRILVCLILFSVSARAQFYSGLSKDSLKNVLASMPADSNKVTTLIILGQQYESNVPDSAIYFYQQANELSKRLNYPTGIIRYANNITAVYNVQGRFNESLKLHQEALKLEEQHQLTALRIKTLLNIGVVYQYKEDFKTAAAHYLKYLPVFEQQGNAQELSLIYANLCALYHKLNQPEKAIVYGRKSYEYALKTNEAYTIARACNNMSNALKELGKQAEREFYLNKAYELAKEIDDIEMQETVLINLGDLLMDISTPEKYIPIYQKALPLADSLDDVNGQSLAMQGIANGLFMQRQFKQAEAQATEALAFCRQHQQHEPERNLLMLLSDIQIALGNLPASVKYRAQYDSVYSAVLSKDLQKNVQELETKYEVEKKQSQLFKQRNWLYLSLAGLLLMLLLWFWGFRYHRQRQQNVRLKSLLEGQSQERQRISQEMHDDMGSGLTSILFISRGLGSQNDAAVRIEQTTKGLVQKMNEIIWTMNAEHDTLESLVAYLRQNIAESLENAGIAYEFLIPDTLPQKSLSQDVRRNIYLAVREAVHNIIKHAQATRVVITITDNLKIIVKDNGRGIDTAKLSTFGNGLKNMRRRMETLGGHFDVKTDNTGTSITFVIL